MLRDASKKRSFTYDRGLNNHTTPIRAGLEGDQNIATTYSDPLHCTSDSVNLWPSVVFLRLAAGQSDSYEGPRRDTGEVSDSPLA